jgi:hypothetical protein
MKVLKLARGGRWAPQRPLYDNQVVPEAEEKLRREFKMIDILRNRGELSW